MLNQLLRFTLVSSLLLWLRPRWRGLLLLAVFVVLVHVLHGEYLGYVTLSGNDAFLVWSYVLKWLALGVGVLAYFLFAVVNAGRGERAQAPKRAESRRAVAPEQANDDGFDFLRRKKTLQGRADKIIDSEVKQKG